MTRLLAQGRIDTTEPLRWRGRLRENTQELPWGQRFEIDLEQMEFAGQIIPVTGGLRLNLYRDSRKPIESSDWTRGLKAGDRLEALVRARPPKNFQDPGAFDTSGHLARLKIDLLGTLRSEELLQLIDHPRPTIPQRFARIRGAMLIKLNSLLPNVPE